MLQLQRPGSRMSWNAARIHARGLLFERIDFCAGSVDVTLGGWRPLADGSVALVTASEDGAALGYPPPEYQEQLRKLVNLATTRLANEILKARARPSP
jgi:hypothetical protein